MKTIKITIAMLLLATVLGVAQADSTGGENALARAAIQVQRRNAVEMNMKIDQATAKIFWPLYNEYMEAMQKPTDRAAALLTDYASNWMDLSDEKSKILLDEFLGVKQDQLNVRKSFAKKFSKSLPPKVVARFFQIENKLDAVAANELAQNVPLVH